MLAALRAMESMPLNVLMLRGKTNLGALYGPMSRGTLDALQRRRLVQLTDIQGAQYTYAITPAGRCVLGETAEAVPASAPASGS
ncbi:hypothetical protein KHC28_11715 [Ancylobacter sonchi]|uniref:hypothetical protein n=1 Tax=Ancylobacter sonchi TaxID=1937790 RepID=UPI001BD4D31A|nr:hypothetical protein [Ancylobacter sonchi]MBS7534323.1 hypothetical protein [Ancylobacter sonchi]